MLVFSMELLYSHPSTWVQEPLARLDHAINMLATQLLAMRHPPPSLAIRLILQSVQQSVRALVVTEGLTELESMASRSANCCVDDKLVPMAVSGCDLVGSSNAAG